MVGSQISAVDLKAELERGLPEALLIDVRTPEEFARGYITGAKNIPVDEIENHAAELAPFKKIYVYCLSGGRSQLAVTLLTARGVSAELYSVTSGLLAWRKEGYPVHS